MPRTISSFGLQEKNKLTSSTVWLIGLEITIPGVSVPVRVISNNESVTWREESWIAFPFQLGTIGEESKGEVPRVELRISNVSRTMESYIQSYSTYCKTNGFSPITLTIYVINNQQGSSSGVITDTTDWGAVTDTGQLGAVTDDLYTIANPDPEASFDYELQSIRTDSTWATFTLGAANPWQKRFPMHRMMKNHCRFVFKDTLCGYTGTTATYCDKTLTRCRTLDSGTATSVATAILYDTSKTWTTDEWSQKTLTVVRPSDGLRKSYLIISNTATSIGLMADEAPPLGAYTISNSKRFGGFPGIGLGGLRLA